MDEDRFERMHDHDLRAAIADTEFEIWSDAIGDDAYANEHANQMLDDLSRPEGWDGGDLGIEEVAHRNLFGDTQTNFDRPIAAQNEADLQAENDALRAQVAEQQTFISDTLLEPTSKQAQEAGREAVRKRLQDDYGLYDLEMPSNPEKLDRFINEVTQLTQYTQALENARGEASMVHAHKKYGRDFEDAYNDLQQMDTNNPLSHSIMQAIKTAADPGEKLMEFHNNPIVQGLGPSNRPPFMPHFNSPAPPRTQRPLEGDWHGRR
jgi:hypothetical protein